LVADEKRVRISSGGIVDAAVAHCNVTLHGFVSP
jgi:hypothetical protein